MVRSLRKELGLVPVGAKDLTEALQDKKIPGKFIEYLRLIPIEDLLEDRLSQACIHYVMRSFFSRDDGLIERMRGRGNILLKNPYPVLELKSRFIYDAFRLKDDEFFYYFPDGWPVTEKTPGRYIQEAPDYLRPEDVIQSGVFSPQFPEEVRERAKEKLGINDRLLEWMIYTVDPAIMKYAVEEEMPFNKPINRVPTKGGVAERYNTKKGEWEPNGDGVYTPPIRERLRKRV